MLSSQRRNPEREHLGCAEIPGVFFYGCDSWAEIPGGVILEGVILEGVFGLRGTGHLIGPMDFSAPLKPNSGDYDRWDLAPAGLPDGLLTSCEWSCE